ncbi:C4-dicarboxylate ABC transporter permease [Candidatus Endobugula sertula]|uniref:TRAP transporter small permease protein n=1 Tax=Candidatus Endobugula sertula TaxID=62101 RepID=A0A1D2QU49_9GAMM|nr:C4-dicarboxylate ABC transporter permease [Candidatus Endobugula sertula]
MKFFLEKTNDYTEQVEKFIIGSGIILMMINSTANAIGRYVFNRSIFFSEELNQFLIVWISFIGFSYAVRKGRNIRMTAIYDFMSHRIKKILTMTIAILTAILLFYLSYKATLYVQELKDIKRLSPSLQFPVYIIYYIIPIGLFMAGIQYLVSFIMNITHRDIYISYNIIEEK